MGGSGSNGYPVADPEQKVQCADCGRMAFPGELEAGTCNMCHYQQDTSLIAVLPILIVPIGIMAVVIVLVLKAFRLIGWL